MVTGPFSSMRPMQSCSKASCHTRSSICDHYTSRLGWLTVPPTFRRFERSRGCPDLYLPMQAHVASWGVQVETVAGGGPSPELAGHAPANAGPAAGVLHDPEPARPHLAKTAAPRLPSTDKSTGRGALAPPSLQAASGLASGQPLPVTRQETPAHWLSQSHRRPQRDGHQEVRLVCQIGALKLRKLLMLQE